MYRMCDCVCGRVSTHVHTAVRLLLAWVEGTQHDRTKGCCMVGCFMQAATEMAAWAEAQRARAEAKAEAHRAKCEDIAWQMVQLAERTYEYREVTGEAKVGRVCAHKGVCLGVCLGGVGV